MINSERTSRTDRYTSSILAFFRPSSIRSRSLENVSDRHAAQTKGRKKIDLCFALKRKGKCRFSSV